MHVSNSTLWVHANNFQSDLLQMCVTHFSLLPASEQRNRARSLLAQLVLVRKIMTTSQSTVLHFDNWTQLWDLSMKDPCKIVSALVNALEFDMARDCAKLLLSPEEEPSRGVDDARSVFIHIEEQWALHVLTNEYERKLLLL